MGAVSNPTLNHSGYINGLPSSGLTCLDTLAARMRAKSGLEVAHFLVKPLRLSTTLLFRLPRGSAQEGNTQRGPRASSGGFTGGMGPCISLEGELSTRPSTA